MIDHAIDDRLLAEQFDSKAYTLFEKIGEGGFGRVFRAKQLNTGQLVAIKFMSLDSLFDAATKKRYIERFERETQLCSRLQHPNIVRLLDKGQCNELFYAVFEYVEGQTLKQRLAESGPLAPSAAAQIMTQVLDALSHAHEQGVIHRDIKPANIMLSKAGTKTHAKVLDFGIGTLALEARQLDHKTITLTRETLGTPAYSAPEQLRGEPPTPKTDIYVWGLVFIESLTAQPAISGSSLAAIFHKQLNQSNVPIPAALAGHPVATLLRRVLHKQADERAASAAEVYHELSQLNFSTLVGDITGSVSLPASNHSTTAQTDDDATQITGLQLSQTAMTERKQITALSLSLHIKATGDNQIDHEVADALHRDQLAQCIDIAIRFGACHVGTLAGSLLFYFGYPLVSDNDGRLCARTALEISSKINKRNVLLKQTQGLETSVKMGMNSGIVTIHADAIPDGETANIAAQLAQMAAHNQILTTPGSKRQLDAYLEFQPQSSQQVGLSNQPMPIYSLIGEHQVEAFGFLRGNKNNHQLIGREQELESLTKLVQNKQYHHGASAQCAHVHGEAGIGKSRLIFELRTRASGFTHYVAQCLPEHKNNALYPILNVVKHKYSLDALNPETAAQALAQALTGHKHIKAQQTLPILCSWLTLPLPEDIQAAVYSPDIQKQMLFDALIALLVRPTTMLDQQPGLFLFEDMHWADPTSIEFIAKLVNDTGFKTSNDVFISTSRQALPTSLDNGMFASVALDKLNQDKTAEFVRMLFCQQELSPNLLDTVVTRTDGIPLFIEELVDMLRQKGLVKHVNGVTDFINQEVIEEIPGSLRDSLQQKLDGLVYAKETAQLAATIGREFDYDLLVAASQRREEQVQTDLDELVSAELVYLQRKVGGDSYIFKHALVRDAAYESMVYEFKLINHSSIAESMELLSASKRPQQPIIYVNHLFLSVQYAKAYENSLILSQELLSNGNYANATALIEQALKYTDGNKTNRTMQENIQEADLRSFYSVLLMTTTGFASSALKTNIDILNTLATKDIGLERQCAIYFNALLNNIVLASYREAFVLYNQFKIEASHKISAKFQPIYHFVNGLMFQGLNQQQQAIKAFVAAADSHDEKQLSYYHTLVPYDLLSAIHAYQSISLQQMNYQVESKVKMEQALNRTQVYKDPHTLAHLYALETRHCYFERHIEAMRCSANKAFHIAKQHNIVNWMAISKFFIGWINCQDGEYKTGISQMKESRDNWSQTGANSHLPWFTAIEAECHFDAGNLAASQMQIRDAINLYDSFDEECFAQDISKIRNKLLKDHTNE